MGKREELADAIASLLNSSGNSYSLAFRAERLDVPFRTAADLADLKVSVFTGSKSSVRRTRTEFEHVYKPLLAVQQKIAGADEAARRAHVDALQTLVEEIEDVLESIDEPLAELGFIGFDENEAERDSYNLELLRSEGVFATTITLQFQD